MKISLGQKAFLSALIIALVSGIGIYLIQSEMTEIQNLSQTSIQSNISSQTLAQHALIAAKSAEAIVASAIATNQDLDLEKIEDRMSLLQGYLTDLDLIVNALSLGTESLNFKTASGGITYEQWQRRGWHTRYKILEPRNEIKLAALKVISSANNISDQAPKTIKLLRRATYLSLQDEKQKSKDTKKLALLEFGILQNMQRSLEASIETLINISENLTSQILQEAASNQNKVINKSLLVFVLLFTLFATFSYLGWRKLVLNPLQTILNKLRLVGQGNLHENFKTTRTDELGDLSNGLATMLGELSTRTVSRDFVDNIIQSMADTLVVVASSSSIIRVNKATCNLLKYDEHELIGKPIALITSTQNNGGYLSPEEEEKLWQLGSISNIEKIYFSKHGEKIPMLFSASIMKRADGKVDGIVCVAQDIRQRKKTQNALLQAKSAIESAGIGSSKISLEGNYKESDPLYSQLIGLYPYQLIGKRWSSIIYDADHEIALSAISEMNQMGKSEFIARAQKTNGSTFYCKIIIVESRDEHGNIDGFYSFLLNVDKETRALHDVEKARDAAIATAKVKADFLANMSHEIRTPMNGVIGMTELLLDTELNIEQRELALTVKNSADSLLSVINDILDFSKLESGKFKLCNTEFEGHIWFSRVLNLMQVHAQKKSQELIGLFGPEIPTKLVGDYNRIQQILVNLIGNAIKFTPEGGGVIVMAKLAAVTNTSASVHFSVSDSGVGIPTEKLDSIFEAFVQADTSTTRKFGGTGLGLSISKELVSLMGGKIWVESALGIGSVFHVVIPFEISDVKDIDDLKLQQIEERINQLSRLKVAIIDENATHVKSISRLLESWGMIPNIITSWKLGVNELRRSKGFYNLVIVNVDQVNDPWVKEAELEYKEFADDCPFLFLMPRKGEVKVPDSSLTINARTLEKPATYSSLLDNIVAAIANLNPQPLPSNNNTLAEKTLQKDNFKAKSLSILVAEDNNVNQKLVEKILLKAGHKVQLVGTGKEALDMLEREQFNLILMDIQMPEMGGDEAIQRIRKGNGPVAKIPIIALTAHSMAGDREKYIEIGANDYVSKPIKKEDLFSAIERTCAANLATDTSN